MESLRHVVTAVHKNDNNFYMHVYGWMDGTQPITLIALHCVSLLYKETPSQLNS